MQRQILRKNEAMKCIKNLKDRVNSLDPRRQNQLEPVIAEIVKCVQRNVSAFDHAVKELAEYDHELKELAEFVASAKEVNGTMSIQKDVWHDGHIRLPRRMALGEGGQVVDGAVGNRGLLCLKHFLQVVNAQTCKAIMGRVNEIAGFIYENCHSLEDIKETIRRELRIMKQNAQNQQRWLRLIHLTGAKRQLPQREQEPPVGDDNDATKLQKQMDRRAISCIESLRSLVTLIEPDIAKQVEPMIADLTRYVEHTLLAFDQAVEELAEQVVSAKELNGTMLPDVLIRLRRRKPLKGGKDHMAIKGDKDCVDMNEGILCLNKLMIRLNEDIRKMITLQSACLKFLVGWKAYKQSMQK